MTLVYLLSLFTAPSSAPVDLAAAIVSSTSVTLSWDPPPENETNGIIASYIVRYSDGPGSLDVPGTNTSITIGNLTPFTEYTFNVLAVTVAEGPAASVMTTTSEDGMQNATGVFVRLLYIHLQLPLHH